MPARRPQLHPWSRAPSAMERQEHVSAGAWQLLLLESDIRKLFRVTQHAPDRLARRGYGGRGGGVIILKKRHDFQQPQLELLSQLGERRAGTAVAEGLELAQPVDDPI